MNLFLYIQALDAYKYVCDKHITVYDRKGNLIRKGCEATNKIPDLEASRGQRVQLNLTVNPTYLYVLSDPDLDNPTVKVEN